MEKASADARFRARRASTATGLRRCRRSSRTRASIRAGVEEADVFAVHQEGGYSCVEVFFFRTGQNWGNRAYFPRADRSLDAGRGARRVPRAVLRRQAAAALHLPLARDRGTRAARRGAVDQEPAARSRSRCRSAARRRSWSTHALRQCARGAGPQARRDRVAAEAARRRSARRFGLPRAAAPHRGLRQQPHPGHQRGRRDDRRRARRAFARTSTASSTSSRRTSRRATTSA